MIGYENVTCGIYVIKNKKTGQMYVGQSTNVESRFKSHCQIPSIDMAIAIEGEDNFEFNIIEEVSKDDLLERERYWIDFYNTELDSNHYNSRTSRVYFLWDTSFCRFKKKDMFHDNREPNPCKCFVYYYNNYGVAMGLFHDFVSVQIVNDLVQEAIKDEIK